MDQLRPAVVILVLLTLVTGVAYPLARDRASPRPSSRARRTAA